MLYEHYLDLMSDLSTLVTELSEHPDPAVASRVVTLLRRVDLVHREGLVRLMTELRARGAADVVTEAIDADSVVRVFLGLYGLADLGLSPESEEDDAPEHTGFFPLEQLAVRRSRA